MAGHPPFESKRLTSPVFSASLSTHPLAAAATGEVVGRAIERVGVSPDVAVCLVSGTHGEFMREIQATVRHTLAPRSFIGATVPGVTGGSIGVADRPAIALWCANIGPVEAFVLGTPTSQPTLDSTASWPFANPPAGNVILLADLASFPLESFLSTPIAQDRLTVVGGSVLDGSPRRPPVLVCGHELVHSGAVGLFFPSDSLNCTMNAFVSYGSRAIGPQRVVTAARTNVVYELDGVPALDCFDELLSDIAPQEPERMGGGFALGPPSRAEHAEWESAESQDDVLLSKVLGARRAERAIVVASAIPIGTTVQFSATDVAFAEQDLDRRLQEAHTSPVLSTLVFTDLRRDSSVFDVSENAATHIGGFGPREGVGMLTGRGIGPRGSRSCVQSEALTALMFRAN